MIVHITGNMAIDGKFMSSWMDLAPIVWGCLGCLLPLFEAYLCNYGLACEWFPSYNTIFVLSAIKL